MEDIFIKILNPTSRLNEPGFFRFLICQEGNTALSCRENSGTRTISINPQKDILAKYPDYKIMTYILYIVGNKGFKGFKTS